MSGPGSDVSLSHQLGVGSDTFEFGRRRSCESQTRSSDCSHCTAKKRNTELKHFSVREGAEALCSPASSIGCQLGDVFGGGWTGGGSVGSGGAALPLMATADSELLGLQRVSGWAAGPSSTRGSVPHAWGVSSMEGLGWWWVVSAPAPSGEEINHLLGDSHIRVRLL